MTDFSVKNFWGYTDDDSQNKELLMLMAKPDGGGGYNLINMTKEEFFALTGQSIDFTIGSTGDVITFDGDTYKLLYAAGGNLLFKGTSFGVSSNGTSNVVQMNATGTLRIGELTVASGTVELIDDSNSFSATISRTLKADTTDEFEFIGDTAMTVATASDSGSTNAPVNIRSLLYMNVDGGSIASHTINFPILPRNNQIFELAIDGDITTLTLQGSSVTIDKPITAADGYTSGKWCFNSSDLTWYKINNSTSASSGGQVNTVVGTSGQITVNASDPVNPIVSLPGAVTNKLSSSVSGGSISGTESVNLTGGVKKVYYEATANCTISGTNLASAIPGTTVTFVIYASGGGWTMTFNNSQFSNSDFTTPTYAMTSTTILIVDFEVIEGSDLGLAAGNILVVKSDNT